MQKEIINAIKEEQSHLKKALTEENPELTFFEEFLRKIDFANINTYNNISIEELIMAYVKSRDDSLSLEKIKEIADNIVPIFEKCTCIFFVFSSPMPSRSFLTMSSKSSAALRLPP